MKKFSFCVSNPPYQISIKNGSANNSAYNIFQYFYFLGLKISSYTTMIFPGGRWLQQQYGFEKEAIKILQTVNVVEWFSNLDEERIFDNIVIRDGLAIVFTYHHRHEFVLNDCEFPRPFSSDNILPLSRKYVAVIKKLKQNFSQSINGLKKTRNLSTLRSFWVERNSDKVVEITEKNSLCLEEIKQNFSQPILAWLANDKPGSAKRVKEYCLDASHIVWNDENKKVFQQWKVCAPQGNISKVPEKTQYFVVDNQHIVGESWLIVGAFDSRVEAENYQQYLQTKLVKSLLAESKGGNIKTWGLINSFKMIFFKYF